MAAQLIEGKDLNDRNCSTAVSQIFDATYQGHITNSAPLAGLNHHCVHHLPDEGHPDNSPQFQITDIRINDAIYSINSLSRYGFI